jgi:hypothetical protein
MRTRAEQESAFLNIPYDHRYENLYLAVLAGLCAFGLRPRAAIEIPGAIRKERGGSLFETRSFQDLAVVAQQSAQGQVVKSPTLLKSRRRRWCRRRAERESSLHP